jgi:hypothetical protein
VLEFEPDVPLDAGVSFMEYQLARREFNFLSYPRSIAHHVHDLDVAAKNVRSISVVVDSRKESKVSSQDWSAATRRCRCSKHESEVGLEMKQTISLELKSLEGSTLDIRKQGEAGTVMTYK